MQAIFSMSETSVATSKKICRLPEKIGDLISISILRGKRKVVGISKEKDKVERKTGWAGIGRKHDQPKAAFLPSNSCPACFSGASLMMEPAIRTGGESA
jgi:hypothetical protein